MASITPKHLKQGKPSAAQKKQRAKDFGPGGRVDKAARRPMRSRNTGRDLITHVDATAGFKKHKSGGQGLLVTSGITRKQAEKLKQESFPKKTPKKTHGRSGKKVSD